MINNLIPIGKIATPVVKNCTNGLKQNCVKKVVCNDKALSIAAASAVSAVVIAGVNLKNGKTQKKNESNTIKTTDFINKPKQNIVKNDDLRKKIEKEIKQLGFMKIYEALKERDPK